MSRRVQWRYMVVGLGFVGLAGVRGAQGAPVWAAVFLLASAVNVWLAFHEGPSATAAEASSEAARVDRSEVDLSLEGYRTSVRQWQVLGVVCLLVGGGLLLLQPLVAVFAGAAALFALHRARRAGRAVATLQRAQLVCD
ncbi:hypothetical protein [Streptomyces albidus (ex Kaewkla and Franco 2022)]|uniref:hypothetical protein n=1 Tax=Streptomyces albidus (ex Kaewkla and Franco 2022) TaxID=722709 RepID=UPI0015EFA4BF|nr:hypothetical protein [Streptomyces albidus (ex Kaewkla and Franco 2022)]